MRIMCGFLGFFCRFLGFIECRVFGVKVEVWFEFIIRERGVSLEVLYCFLKVSRLGRRGVN